MTFASKFDRIVFTIVLILGLSVLFGVVACEQMTEDSELSESSDARDYHYLDRVSVTNGFYKDWSCLVLREYRRSVFCKISSPLLDEKLQINVNLQKSSITKVQ